MKTHVGTFEIVDESEEVARIAAGIIVDAAQARPRCGLVLSGGSTPRRAYELTVAIAHAHDFVGVHLWLADERAVPLEHADSNGGMLLELWGDALGFVEDHGGGVRLPVARLHVMPCTRGVDKQIKDVEWALVEHAGARPRPELAVLGVGADGHAAALFAGDPALEAGGWFAPARGARVTATRHLLAASQRIVFVAAGAAKAEVIAAIAADPASVPAGQVALDAKAAGADVTWILDRAAVASIA